MNISKILLMLPLLGTCTSSTKNPPSSTLPTQQEIYTTLEKDTAQVQHPTTFSLQEKLPFHSYIYQTFHGPEKYETVASPYQSMIQHITEPIILGNPELPQISLTFDDGYHPQAITQMLQLLKEHQIHATFFIIGECIARFPQLWKQAIEDGHQICNHSDTHNRYFNTKDTLLLEQEILGREKKVTQYLGEEYFLRMKKEFPFFRFPGGKWSNATLSIVKKYGYLPVHWLYESKFTNEPINGGIVLFHFNQKDINQVREYLTNTTKQMLPLSEILNPQTGYEPIGWKNFSSKIAPKKQKSLEKAD